MNPIRNEFRGKNVLITGGLGFIGSNLAHRLVALNASVTLVDSLIPDYGGNLFNIAEIRDCVRANIADVRDEFSINYLVRSQDYIFNLAGQVSHVDSMTDPHADLEINCRSQLSLLEACRKNNSDVKIIFAGTRQQYGRALYLPVDERHLMQPTDVNGINKMAGERYHILYNNVYGIRAVSLRLTNTYGPRQLIKHNRQGFIGWFIRQAIEGREIQLFGDGSQKRDFTYVDDVVDAMLLAAASKETDGEVFNLGGERPYSLLDFVSVLKKCCPNIGYRLVPFPPETKKIDIGDFYADFSKIRKKLGWRPKTSLEDGVKETIAFYQKHKEHYLW